MATHLQCLDILFVHRARERWVAAVQLRHQLRAALDSLDEGHRGAG
jgi:hypothetical protein